MSKVKKSSYYSAVVKRAGLIVPVVAAVVMFALCFFLNNYSLLGKMQEKMPTAYWIFIGGAIGGIFFTFLYLITGFKHKGACARDTLLLAVDFLMVLVLVGIVAFSGKDFLSIKSLEYLIALVVVVIINIVRKLKFNPADEDDYADRTPNASFGEYFKALNSKYGVWLLLVAALAVYAVIYAAVERDTFAKFAGNNMIIAGVAVVAGLFAIALIISVINRLRSHKIGFIDALFFSMLITTVCCVSVIIMHYDLISLIVWVVGLLFLFVFVRLFAFKTHIVEDPYSNPAEGAEFKKGAKYYFKQFNEHFSWVGLIGLSLFLAAFASIPISVDIFSWLAATKLQIIAIAAAGVVALFVLLFVAVHARSKKVGIWDALLTVVCFTLALSAVPCIVEYNDNMLVPLIIIGVAFVIAGIFSLIRLKSVGEYVVEAAAAPEETEEEAPASEYSDEPVEEVTEEGGEEPLEEETEETYEEPVEEVTEETYEEPVEEVAEETYEEPYEEVTEEPTEEPYEEVTEEPAEEPYEEVTEETYEETYEEPVEEAADETYEEPTEEPTYEEQPAYTDDTAAASDDAVFPLLRKPLIPFSEKIDNLPDDFKNYYAQLKDRLLSYKGVKSRVSHKFDTYRHGRTTLAKIGVVGKKSLRIYLALDPQLYDYKKFYQRDLSDRKMYTDIPCMLVIKSGRSVKRASRLISEVMGKFGIDHK